VFYLWINGATANTTVAGSLAIKKGLNNNCDGMLTETEIFSHLELVQFDQLVFGGWDVNGQDAYKAARFNRVLEPWLVEDLRPDLEGIRPWKAVITKHDVDSTKRAESAVTTSILEEGIKTLKQDILSFKGEYDLDKVIVVILLLL